MYMKLKFFLENSLCRKNKFVISCKSENERLSLRSDVYFLKIYLIIYTKVNIHLPTVLNTKLQFSAKSKKKPNLPY